MAPKTGARRGTIRFQDCFSFFSVSLSPSRALRWPPPIGVSVSPRETLQVFPEILAPTQGTYTFSGLVDPTLEDPGTVANSNGASSDTTVFAGADIELTVSGPSTAASGAIVDYVFSAENLGPDTSDGYTFTLPKPAGLDNIITPPGCTFDGSDYVCFIPGPINPGDPPQDITFTGQISLR